MSPDPSLKPIAAASDRASDHQSKLIALRKLMVMAERRISRTRTNRHSHRDSALRVMPPIWSPGIPEIDAALPQRGLRPDAVHEIAGSTYGDAVAASGYILALLRRLSALSKAATGPILWCQNTDARREFGPVHGAGLRAFGLDRERFLFADAARNRDALWVLEESARASSLLAVVGEVAAVSFTETRRLSLAAAAGGTPVLLLRSHNDLAASAAETRWRVAAAPGRPDPFVPRAPGNPQWTVELMRCRGGRPGIWTVEWDYETHCFRLAEQFSSRSPEAAGTHIAPSDQRHAFG